MEKSTLNLLLERVYTCPSYTIGHLYAVSEGKKELICDILEDSDRGLLSSMPLSEIKRKKVYGETAIPRGIYNIRMDIQSPKYSNFTRYPWAKKYSGFLPRLENVNGFDGILMHVGNKAADSYGCLLCGYNEAKGMVLRSKDAFGILMDKYLVPAHKAGRKITIEIKAKY